MKNTQGMKVKIFSWWEGLYGWLVIVISTMIATVLCTFLLPLFDLDYSIKVANYTSYQKQIITIFGITFIIVSALLYQFEYCFKRSLVFVNRIENQKTNNK
jgi:quinol-cytochrome oxidoreductase complex cytochrome b subunit